MVKRKELIKTLAKKFDVPKSAIWEVWFIFSAKAD